MKIVFDEQSIEENIAILRDHLAEKRSDIYDILDAILDGRDWHTEDIEHRFIEAKDKETGRIYEYDTLTTEIRYCHPENPDKGYILEEHDYSD